MSELSDKKNDTFKTTIHISVGNHIRYCRLQKKLTPVELGKLTGKDR